MAVAGIRRAYRIVGSVLDKMNLRLVGNDLGDCNRMLHVETDAEAVAGALVGGREG